MSSAAIYARVSSARQKEQQTIGSQTAALRAHAEQLGLEVPAGWVFSDDGHSGATLVRPALEKLRDLVAQVPVEVVIVYSPDRLARKYAYQALLIEEFAKAGSSVVFVKGPSSDSPEDALLVQFQGMIAEYERAQILERTRRGKAHRARQGTVNVLSGAPFGYRYVRRSEHAEARYEVVAHEAVLVAELFRRYVEDGVAIAELARWLSDNGVATRTGKSRWDRSVIWGMLRNPAYAGRACFGKTMRSSDQPGLNRSARLAGRSTPRSHSVTDRAREDWLEIPVPALVAEDTWARAQRRLADNKRYAARNSKVPSLLQGLAACSSCGYAYYRGHATTTAGNKIYYYRCLGSDNYRYEHGRVCDNKPVRADYLDALVWDHITGLLADPTLIRAEIDRRLEQLRTADPTTATGKRLEQALATTGAAVARLIKAYQEELISIDELRERMPELRARETSLRSQLDTVANQLVDRETYLKLAAGLEEFLTQLRGHADTAAVPEQQRVLRLLVKDVLIGPERILIRHSIPSNRSATPTATTADGDTDEEPAPSSRLRWRSRFAAARQRLPAPAGPGMAWRVRAAGAVRRRCAGDVPLEGASPGRARAVDRPARRARSRTEGSQNQDRPATGRRRGSRLPGLPPPAGALLATAWLWRIHLPRPVALTQGDAARPGPHPVPDHAGPAGCTGRTDCAGDQPVPARLGGLLPLRKHRPRLRRDHPVREDAARPVPGQATSARPGLGVQPGLPLTQRARADLPQRSRRRPSAPPGLAGQAEHRR